MRYYLKDIRNGVVYEIDMDLYWRIMAAMNTWPHAYEKVCVIALSAYSNLEVI